MLVRVCAAKKNKTKAEMDAAQVLFHGQRMEKQELATSCPHGERDQILKTGRSEANDVKAYALISPGRGRAFLDIGCYPLCILFRSASSSCGHMASVCHLVANIVRSAQNETEGQRSDSLPPWFQQVLSGFCLLLQLPPFISGSCDIKVHGISISSRG